MSSISFPDLNQARFEPSQMLQTKLGAKPSVTRHKKAKRLSGIGKLYWSLLIVLFSAMVASSAFAQAITLVTTGEGEHTAISDKDYDALGEYLYYDYMVTNTGAAAIDTIGRYSEIKIFQNRVCGSNDLVRGFWGIRKTGNSNELQVFEHSRFS